MCAPWFIGEIKKYFALVEGKMGKNWNIEDQIICNIFVQFIAYKQQQEIK